MTISCQDFITEYSKSACGNFSVFAFEDDKLSEQ